MKPEHVCVNHPNEEAVSVCHHCHDWFCLRCLKEGPEYYYCNKPKCHEAFLAVIALSDSKCPFCGELVFPDTIYCGSCGKQIRELTAAEKADDLVTVARYKNSTEAYLCQTILESVDIEAYIADEHMFTINPAFYAFGGVKLKVKKSDFDKAALVLNDKQV
jgi:hypothetical protein